jgi:hypothetical protein
MNILVLESEVKEQELISNLLDGDMQVEYETSVPKAINALGIRHTDFVLVDADCKSKICSWQDLVESVKQFKINYAIFSSNGKVGLKDGHRIVSIKDIPAVVSGNLQNASQV